MEINGASAASSDGLSTTPSGERPARILVVDDIDDNRELLRRRLSRRGFEVVEASDGFEALRVVREGEIDLILLDIMMPGMDGTEVLRSLRVARSSIDLPVIMVSAKDQSEDVAHSLALGANDYVTKPIDFTIALARIQSHLSRRRDAQAASRRVAEEEAAKLKCVMAENCETLRRTNERLEAETGNRRQSEERLEYLAQHDPLTGLMVLRFSGHLC